MKDSILERWLAQRGYAWRYAAVVSLEKVKISELAHSQLRLGVPINADQVDLYARAYADGADLPAIVLCEEAGRLDILNGIHRISALVKLERRETDAYIVDVKTQDEIEEFRRTVNLLNGLGLTTRERIEQAVHLKLACGWPTEKAARVFGLSDSSVSMRIAADKGAALAAKAMDVDIGRIEHFIPATALARLPGIKRQDVLMAICKIAKIVRPKLSGKTLELLCAEGRPVSTDAEARTLLLKWRRDYPAPARRNRANESLPTERAVIYRARIRSKQYESFLERQLLGAELDRAERVLAIRLLRSVSARLTRMVVRLERITIGNKSAQEKRADRAAA